MTDIKRENDKAFRPLWYLVCIVGPRSDETALFRAMPKCAIGARTIHWIGSGVTFRSLRATLAGGHPPDGNESRPLAGYETSDRPGLVYKGLNAVWAIGQN